jgi:hypothetical protein
VILEKFNLVHVLGLGTRFAVKAQMQGADSTVATNTCTLVHVAGVNDAAIDLT